MYNIIDGHYKNIRPMVLGNILDSYRRVIRAMVVLINLYFLYIYIYQKGSENTIHLLCRALFILHEAQQSNTYCLIKYNFRTHYCRVRWFTVNEDLTS